MAPRAQSAAEGSKIAVYGALVGNFAIAVTKFIAAGVTGSAAMLAEGIHSTVASLAVGLLLAGVATFLIWQCRGLLVGTGVRPETARGIQEIARGVEGVENVASPLTMYLGPESVLLAIDVRFRPDAPASEVEEAVDRIESRIRERYPLIKHIYIEAESVGRRPGASQVSR